MKSRTTSRRSSRKNIPMPYVMGITGLGIVAYAVSRFARSFSSKNMSSKDYDRSDFSSSRKNRNQNNNRLNQSSDVPSGLSASRNTGAGISENTISGI